MAQKFYDTLVKNIIARIEAEGMTVPEDIDLVILKSFSKKYDFGISFPQATWRDKSTGQNIRTIAEGKKKKTTKGNLRIRTEDNKISIEIMLMKKNEDITLAKDNILIDYRSLSGPTVEAVQSYVKDLIKTGAPNETTCHNYLAAPKEAAAEEMAEESAAAAASSSAPAVKEKKKKKKKQKQTTEKEKEMEEDEELQVEQHLKQLVEPEVMKNIYKAVHDAIKDDGVVQIFDDKGNVMATADTEEGAMRFLLEQIEREMSTGQKKVSAIGKKYAMVKLKQDMDTGAPMFEAIKLVLTPDGDLTEEERIKKKYTIQELVTRGVKSTDAIKMAEEVVKVPNFRQQSGNKRLKSRKIKKEDVKKYQAALSKYMK